MDDKTLSSVITAVALTVFLISGWATFWIYRARRGGWNRLAATYSTRTRTDSMPRRWQTVKLMPAKVNYRWLVTLRLTVDGLYISPMFPIRFGHDRLLIPWNDIEIFAVETYPADRLYDLKFANEPGIKMRVGVAVAQFIRRAADNVQYFVEPQVQVKIQPRQTAAAQQKAPTPSSVA